MQVGDIGRRDLSRFETWMACLLVMGLQILPLVLADYPYMDDLWRAQKAGSAWTEQGRILTDLLYAFLGFGRGAPDLFPFPLLLATVVAARALADLACYYFKRPTLTAVLVVLPLWLSPFFLQNLSYQYDAPAMALALSCSVWAIVLGAERWPYALVGMCLVAIAASFYQLSINIFASLCCIEIVREVVTGASLRRTLQTVVKRMAQLFGGTLLYFLTAYQLITVPRTSLLPLDENWIPVMLGRSQVVFGHLELLATPGTRWFWLPLLTLAVLALGKALWRLWRSDASTGQKFALVTLLSLSVFGSFWLVFGMMYLFAYFDDGARMLMGFGALYVLVGWLAYQALTGISLRLAWLLVIPCIFMLSFSFAYGRVLILQKEMHEVVAQALVQEVLQRPELANANAIYIFTPKLASREQWLPAAEGAFRMMPALRYVLNINYLVLSDFLPRYGLTQFSSLPDESRSQLKLSAPPLVVSHFFDIYLLDGAAYVVIKVPNNGANAIW